MNKSFLMLLLVVSCNSCEEAEKSNLKENQQSPVVHLVEKLLPYTFLQPGGKYPYKIVHDGDKKSIYYDIIVNKESGLPSKEELTRICKYIKRLHDGNSMVGGTDYIHADDIFIEFYVKVSGTIEGDYSSQIKLEKEYKAKINGEGLELIKMKQ